MTRALTFRARRLPPSVEDANYHHLIWDTIWFGLAFPATTRYLPVYAIRLGATPLEIGLISALPALILIFSSALATWWRGRYTSSLKAIFWPTLSFRFVFLLPAFAPLFLPHASLWLIVGASLPALAQGLGSVLFLVLMREGVSQQRITELTGRRMMMMYVAVGGSTVALGVWLVAIPFPYNYQAMFVFAFVMALLSMWHVLHIRELYTTAAPAATMPLPDAAVGGRSPWRSRDFGMVAAVVMAAFVAYTMASPVIPLRQVEELGATESYLAVYALLELGGSVLMAALTSRLIQRFGVQTMVTASMVTLALGALLMAVTHSLEVMLVAGLITGMGWVTADVSQFSLFNARTPLEDRTRFSTAYFQMLSLGLFLGPLLGSVLADAGLSLTAVLLLVAGVRLLAGLAPYLFRDHRIPTGM